MAGLHGGNIKEIAEIYHLSEKSIIDFSANINPLGLSENLLKVLKENTDQILHYPDLRYTELKKEIATYHSLTPENIFLGNGAAEVIYSLANVLKSQQLLVLAPTFSEYEDAFAHQKTNIVYFKTKDNDFKVNTTDLMTKIQEEKVDTLCICNPNNPTGTIIEKEEMIKLAKFCQNNQIYLIIDEAFMDFVDEKESLTTELGGNEYLVILRSLTKIFAIPGLRLGYLLTDNSHMMDDLESNAIPWRINCFADMAGRESLKDKQYLAETLSYVEKERLFLESSLTKFTELKLVKSSANFIFFEYLSTVDLQKALIEMNILIRDCSNYKGLDGNYYRIAVRTREENEKLVEALERYFYGKSHS